MPDPVRPSAYPRPQLRRSAWASLDGEWRFSFDDAMTCETPSDIAVWPLTIRVPFAPEARASGIGDTGFHPTCWYEREFEVPAGYDRVYLHFGAVDYEACVWVNDKLVATHEGGHTPFSADITAALQGDGPQKLTVQARDDPEDMEKPRGKQDWHLDPHGIWYPRTTGIWQTVWIESRPPTHIVNLRWTPHLERWEIGLEVFVNDLASRDLRVGIRLKHGDVLLVQDDYLVLRGHVHRRIALSDPGIDDYRNDLLWSPERPTLLDAEIQLWRGKELLDEVHSYTALRSVAVHRDRLLLNGRPYELRLVLDQGYWPDTLMTAPDDDALKRDVELVKEMGFNGVRKHQKIEDPRYLYWADVLGLAVMEEMPSTYRFSNEGVRRQMDEWTSAIERDFSHPCVLIWVPYNESWGVPDLPASPAHRNAVEAFYHLTRTLDQTRPVIGNDGWEASATDIIGIHDYSEAASLQLRYGPSAKLDDLFDRRRPGGRVLTLDGYPHRGQPIFLTEFGGVAYVRPEDRHSANLWGYMVCEDLEEYERVCCNLLDTAHNSSLFAGFCYTQFSDTFQEVNGLLYADRTPKIPLWKIAASMRGPR
jgi:beta-galactosidase/beta-glucuronidase